MSLFVEQGLYVRIAECKGERAPVPRPLSSGFSIGKAYRALGGFNMSESAEMYFMLANDKNEVWFISNRHLRVHCVQPNSTEISYAL